VGGASEEAEGGDGSFGEEAYGRDGEDEEGVMRNDCGLRSIGDGDLRL
jgi:hypothetical protein